MKHLIVFLLLSLASTFLFSQSMAPFTDLLEAAESGILLSSGKTLHGVIPDGTDYHSLTHEQARAAFFALDKSCLDPNTLPDPSTMVELSRAVKFQEVAVPIFLADLHYQDLHPNAAELGWLTLVGDEYMDSSPEDQALMVEHTAFVAFADLDRYSADTYIFSLPSECIYSNLNGELEDIEIDPDDGFGFRSFNPGSSIEVTYEDPSIDRLIRIRAMRDGVERKASFIIRSAGGNSVFPDPQTPPWAYETPTFPWRIETTYEGNAVAGNAYTLMSADGIFDKPFVFVEGIDFGSDQMPLRNGAFGWYEFSSGESDEYPFLYRMPELLNGLRNAGYDIILLDLEDGADLIQRNAALLKHLISLVNASKEGEAELVIAGASMGGQISRVALREMELAETPHCARTWISLDSPHLGANIPISLQNMVHFLAPYSEQANWFAEHALLRPAARQMLIRQTNEDLSLYENYMSFLSEIGYPQETRNIALADGNMNGIGQGFADGAELLNYNCDILGYNLVKFHLRATPGDPYNDASTSSHYVVSELNHSQTQSCSGFLDCLLNPFFILSSVSSTSWLPSSAERLDNAPGGKRYSVLDLAAALNNTLANQGLPNSCETVVDGVVPHHSFISTTSALGIEGASPTDHLNNLLEFNPDACPFDRFYGPALGNLTHSELDEVMVEIAFEETIGGEVLLPEVFTAADPNGSVFNFALPYHNLLRDHFVSDGAVLGVNIGAPVHFGENPEWFASQGEHLEIKTSWCGSEITVGDGGSLLLGDVTSERSASVILRENSSLTLEDGSLLIIDENSSIHIHDGASMTINGGQVHLLDGAKIAVEEGGVLYINSSHPILLEGQGSHIDVKGSIVLGDDIQFQVNCVGEEGGSLRFLSNSVNVIGGENSSVRITGTDALDRILEIAPNAAFWTSLGIKKVELHNGRVTIAESGKLTCGGEFQAHNVRFAALGENYGLHLYGKSRFNDCRFSFIDVDAFLGSTLIRFDACHLMQSDIRILGGGYRVFDSVLNASSITSEGLQYIAHIKNSEILGDGVLINGIVDHSDGILFIETTEISNFETGVYKEGGELRMKCSTMADCHVALHAGLYTTLNMSSLTGGGYNTLEGSNIHIFLAGAEHLWLIKGYNTFYSSTNEIFKGSLFGNCNENCMQKLVVTGNTWPNAEGPTSSEVDLVMVDPNCDQNTPLVPLDGCELKLIDKAPEPMTACGAHDPGGPYFPSDFSKSNTPEDPVLATENYTGVSMSEALLDAIWKSEIYNPEFGDDAISSARLHEIITADLNQNQAEVRMRLRAATWHLMQQVIRQLEEQELTFDPDTTTSYESGLYELTHALNKLTQPNGPIESYRGLMSIELSKIQSLYALELFDLAQETIDFADECGIDMQEQLALNRAALRIANIEQFQDSLPLFYDTEELFELAPVINLPDPVSNNPQGTVFGAWLETPFYNTYPTCQGEQLKQSLSTDLTARAFPIPTSNQVMIDFVCEGGYFVEVFSLLGECVMRPERRFPSGQPTRMDVSALAPGSYLLKLSGASGTSSIQIQIAR